MNPQAKYFLQQGVQCLQNNNCRGAEENFHKALKIDPNNCDALQFLGITFSIQNNSSSAIHSFRKAASIRPNDGIVLFNLAKSLLDAGENSEALKFHKRANELLPGNIDILVNYGANLDKLERHIQAIDCYEKALRLNPNDPEIWSNKGVSQGALNLTEESLSAFDHAIKIDPTYAKAWFNKASAYDRLKFYEEALLHYDKAIALKPDYAEAWANKGSTLHDLNRYEEALLHYDKAIALKPDYAEAWANKALELTTMKFYEEALLHYDKAIALKPDYAEAWANKGSTLHDLNRYEEALLHYDKAIALKPKINWIAGNYLHTKMKICSWVDLEARIEELILKIKNCEKASQPFPVLALADDPSLHHLAAKSYADDRFPARALDSFDRRLSHNKIRIGYYSADYHNHPTAYLIAELFELHDKNKFEIYAFSFGPNIIDEMRKRLTRAFDSFIDVRNQSDSDVVKLSRELEIDIAVDLKGFTQDSRTGIFAQRAAPIQISYLGYPGSMSMDSIDYIVADKILIPEENKSHFSEKVMYMPFSYQVNDRQRPISPKSFSKIEVGLPTDCFVYCCFNNNYKITPKTFDVWMNILMAVKSSVLWLLEDNTQAKKNLQKEAAIRGIHPSRLIFAPRVALAEHLARHHCADLFLDTLPYNAHTTTSDALWSGLPVLTQIGRSFPARVSASLLNGMFLNELIADDEDDYHAMAVDLAMNPQKLIELKDKLLKTKLSAPLFNTPSFTKHIEYGYEEIYRRLKSGLDPEHIYIPLNP